MVHEYGRELCSEHSKVVTLVDSGKNSDSGLGTSGFSVQSM